MTTKRQRPREAEAVGQANLCGMDYFIIRSPRIRRDP